MTIEERARDVLDASKNNIWNIKAHIIAALQAFRTDVINRTKEKVKPAVALELIEFNVSIEDRRKVDRIIDETRII